MMEPSVWSGLREARRHFSGGLAPPPTSQSSRFSDTSNLNGAPPAPTVWTTGGSGRLSTVTEMVANVRASPFASLTACSAPLPWSCASTLIVMTPRDGEYLTDASSFTRNLPSQLPITNQLAALEGETSTIVKSTVSESGSVTETWCPLLSAPKTVFGGVSSSTSMENAQDVQTGLSLTSPTVSVN